MLYEHNHYEKDPWHPVHLYLLMKVQNTNSDSASEFLAHIKHVKVSAASVRRKLLKECCVEIVSEAYPTDI